MLNTSAIVLNVYRDCALLTNWLSLLVTAIYLMLIGHIIMLLLTLFITPFLILLIIMVFTNTLMNHCSLDPAHSTSQRASRSVQPFSMPHDCDRPTDRQTDRATPFVTVGRHT